MPACRISHPVRYMTLLLTQLRWAITDSMKQWKLGWSWGNETLNSLTLKHSSEGVKWLPHWGSEDVVGFVGVQGEVWGRIKRHKGKWGGQWWKTAVLSSVDIACPPLGLLPSDWEGFVCSPFRRLLGSTIFKVLMGTSVPQTMRITTLHLVGGGTNMCYKLLESPSPSWWGEYPFKCRQPPSEWGRSGDSLLLSCRKAAALGSAGYPFPASPRAVALRICLNSFYDVNVTCSLTQSLLNTTGLSDELTCNGLLTLTMLRGFLTNKLFWVPHCWPRNREEIS